MHWAFWILLIAIVLLLCAIEDLLGIGGWKYLINGTFGFCYPFIIRSIFYGEK